MILLDNYCGSGVCVRYCLNIGVKRDIPTDLINYLLLIICVY